MATFLFRCNVLLRVNTNAQSTNGSKLVAVGAHKMWKNSNVQQKARDSAVFCKYMLIDWNTPEALTIHLPAPEQISVLGTCRKAEGSSTTWGTMNAPGVVEVAPVFVEEQVMTVIRLSWGCLSVCTCHTSGFHIPKGGRNHLTPSLSREKQTSTVVTWHTRLSRPKLRHLTLKGD